MKIWDSVYILVFKFQLDCLEAVRVYGSVRHSPRILSRLRQVFYTVKVKIRNVKKLKRLSVIGIFDNDDDAADADADADLEQLEQLVFFFFFFFFTPDTTYGNYLKAFLLSSLSLYLYIFTVYYTSR